MDNETKARMLKAYLGDLVVKMSPADVEKINKMIPKYGNTCVIGDQAFCKKVACLLLLNWKHERHKTILAYKLVEEYLSEEETFIDVTTPTVVIKYYKCMMPNAQLVNLTNHLILERKESRLITIVLLEKQEPLIEEQCRSLGFRMVEQGTMGMAKVQMKSEDQI